MNYYTSDLHLYHRYSIIGSHRPFYNLENMHKTIIHNWNAKVKPTDTVYILGDVSHPKNKEEAYLVLNVIEQLNGRKILIKGNHDSKLLRCPKFKKVFHSVHDYLEISDYGKKVILFHYPIEEWNNFFRGSIHLHGHVHNNDSHIKNIANRFNVGVDVNNFTPVSLKELLEKDK